MRLAEETLLHKNDKVILQVTTKALNFQRSLRT
jgi:hypothetical protein